MIFPFNTREKYLDGNEQKRFDKFLKNEPLAGGIYTNKNGESRKVVKTAYPAGCRIEGRTVYNVFEKFGQTISLYHTPLATVTEKAEAKVWYQNVKTGEYGILYGSEWLKWLGIGFEYEPKKQWVPPPQIQARLNSEKKKAGKEVEAQDAIALKNKQPKPKNDFTISEDAKDA